MPNFDTLVKDVQKLLDGRDLSKTAHLFSEKLGAMVIDRFKRHGEERVPKLYLSNVGKPFRQLWYDLNGFKGEALTPETKFKFLYGDLIEELFLFMAQEAGHDVQGLQQRLEFDGVSGKIDAVIDGVLVDVKSCSTRSFEKFETGKILTDDPFGYIAQLSGYKQALNIPRAAFIAIDKVLGKICVYEITDNVVAEYNLSNRITTVREMLKSETPPSRCYEPKSVSKTDKSGNLVLATGCSYCSHKFECWKDSNNGRGLQTRFYSSGPRWFTHIEKEPNLKSNNYDAFPIKDTA